MWQRNLGMTLAICGAVVGSWLSLVPTASAADKVIVATPAIQQKSVDEGNSATVQLQRGFPYCRTCTFSIVTSPLDIMPSRTGRKASIFSCVSTISTTIGRSCDNRRIFVV